MQSPERYLEQIQTLPAPTTRQIALFASYVSSAHSWYKHLPARKTVPFYVYLDPHGGERFCYESKGRKVFGSIEQPAGGFFHYSGQSTFDYRRRFGYWNYTCDIKSLSSYEAVENSDDKSGFSVRVVDTDGVEFELPKQVQTLGRVAVSALMHAHPALGFWERQWASQQATKDPFAAPNLLKFLKQREEGSPHPGHLPILRTQLAQAIEERNWSGMDVWKQDDFFDRLLNDSGIPMDMRDEIFPTLLEYAECMCSRDEFGLVIRLRKSATPEHPLLPLIVKERIRQIRAIKSAMQRVADFVYTNKLTS